MGIMSKSNRLPERPKPPSWVEVVEDITGAQHSDVVFSLGQDYLTAASSTATSNQERTYNNSLSASEDESPNQDAAVNDAEKVKTSKANVLKLIDLHAELSNSLDSLQEHYEYLKHMREDISQSVSELKVLAENISSEIDDKTGSSVPEKSPSKGKLKKKKKK